MNLSQPVPRTSTSSTDSPALALTASKRSSSSNHNRVKNLASPSSVVQDSAGTLDPLEELQSMFPNVDLNWLKMASKQYKNEDIVTAIAAKICEVRGGHYPKGDATSHISRNTALDELSARFPNCQITFLRERIMAASYDTVNVVTQELLELESKSEQGYPRRLMLEDIAPSDRFRSQTYIQGAQARLYCDFPDHWKSSIRGVLLECNHYYPTAYLKMIEIKTPTWWLPFGRRSPQHIPEMDDEQLLLDVKELDRLLTLKKTQNDQQLAQQLNNDEYTKNGQLITCECCYSDVVWEELTQCQGGHMFCKECVKKYVEVGLFQSGQLRGKPAVCLAGCPYAFDSEDLQRCLDQNVFMTYERLLVEKELSSTGLQLVQCPYCKYAEAKDPVTESRRLLNRLESIVDSLQRKLANIEWTEPGMAMAVLASFQVITASFSINLLLGVFVFIMITYLLYISGIINSYVEKLRAAGLIHPQTVARFRSLKKFSVLDPILPARRKRKPKGVEPFNCQNCRRSSCCKCQKEWTPLHSCYEKEKDSLRLYVEQRVSEAFIRTCPNCLIRFTKIDGCNKIKCPTCKHEMCFVCRRDISKEKYKHFCEHFRVIPGTSCKECDKCDLYHTGDDDLKRKRAAEAARKEWLQRHPQSSHVLAV